MDSGEGKGGRYRRRFRLPAGDRESARHELDEEVRFHLARKVEKLMAQGLSREAAEAEARRRFGDVEEVKAEMARHSTRRVGRMGERIDRLRQDLAYALRQLVRSPGFTAVTLLTLALGVGATTAIFSVVDGILFRPLPYEEPEELVAVWTDLTRRGGPADEWPNFPNLWNLQERSRTLEAVGVWAFSTGTLTGSGPAEQLSGASVDYDMFARVLRVEAAHGRIFRPEEDRPGAPATVLLSHGVWERAFGADPGVVGRSITLNGLSYTAIGVMPEDFRPPFVPDADLWTPLRMDLADHGCGRGNACMQSVARLADGVTLEAARNEVAEIARGMEEEDPEANAGMTWNLQPLQADLVADARVGLLVLLGAAACVLLIACVNEANLLLARGTSRRGELAVRAALGAGRGRLVSQLLTESMVLAVLGGATGVAAAYLLTDALVALAPAGTPRLEEVAVNARVLSFAAAVTVAAGLLFGVVPALRSAGGRLEGALREGGGRGDGGAAGAKARSALVALQVALALVLLTGSGLLLRTFQNLRAVDLGFRAEEALTFRLNLPASRYPDRASLVGVRPLLEERLSRVPGVEAVAGTTSLPLTGFNSDMGFQVEGRPPPSGGRSPAVWYRRVTPGWFETMGTPLVRGRGITASDAAGSAQVAVINETFARRWFPDEDPLGRRINLGSSEEPSWWQIVGVARDVKHFGLREDARIALYAPFDQMPGRTLFVVVRSDRDAAALVPEVRRALASVDPDLAVAQPQALDEVVGAALGPERFVTLLLVLFAGVATVLAVVGLYGVVSYNVNGRLREMGVRLAMGASGAEVGALVVRRSLVVVAAGVVAGLVAAWLLTDFMASLLFGVGANDPVTLVSVTALLAVAATAAAALPARRAARVDPVEVLRSE